MTVALTAERKACNTLFATYPLAVEPGKPGTPVICSMTLALVDGGIPQFFVLTYEDSGDTPAYLLTSRDGTSAADAMEDVLARGLPLPRDGSLYGWVDRGRVTAMIAFYALCAPETPEPSYSPMPDADASEAVWPPFIGERLLGPWLWEYFQAGRIVNLAPLIASTEGAVFWANTVEAIGSGCIAVARDLASPDGWTLPRGRYAYYQHRDAAPSLDDLLADPGKTDLGPRFR